MRVAIGVFAEPPLPGLCRTKLLAAHDPEWAAGLYAAMLRDTLDGLQSIDASEFLVFASKDGEPSLERHLPAPWQIVTDVADAAGALRRLGAANGIAILHRSDAPSAPIAPLAEAIGMNMAAEPFAALGPVDDGSAWVLALSGLDAHFFEGVGWESTELAATIRLRCKKMQTTLRELPPAVIVDEPSGVLALMDELRKNPERAPRTAQFLVTRS